MFPYIDFNFFSPCFVYLSFRISKLILSRLELLDKFVHKLGLAALDGSGLTNAFSLRVHKIDN